MSTAAQPPAVPPTPVPVPHPAERSEITVVSHSNLFYWWPVWAVGFLMAILTFFSGSRLATVPADSIAADSPRVTITKANGEEETLVDREIILLPKPRSSTHTGLRRENPGDSKSAPVHPKLLMAGNQSYGVIFCTVLLICIVITNVPLRGMWSVVVIILLIALSVIFAAWGLWEKIFYYLHLLNIRINMGGYLFISGALFVIWLFTLMFFDRQIYIIFTPGQFKVCTEIGGGEKVYDTMGMKLERQRSDLFRHMILGLGSGDLIVKTSGAQADHFDLPNVLFIGKKVQQIEDLMQKKKMVESR